MTVNGSRLYFRVAARTNCQQRVIAHKTTPAHLIRMEIQWRLQTPENLSKLIFSVFRSILANHYKTIGGFNSLLLIEIIIHFLVMLNLTP